MPFNAVKNLHQSDIGGLVTLNYFYAVTRELSEQTAVPTITHIPHNSEYHSPRDLIFNARQLKNR